MTLPLVGNPQIKTQVQGTKPLSHAYIIAGETGSGRGVLAQFMAQKALCNQENAPCGSCDHCEKVEDRIHPDVQILGNPDGKALSVEQIRQIHKDCLLRPNQAQGKVYAILQADQLGPSAQNALLKILEEPPSYATFLLITGENAALLETIRSRCQLLRLQPVALDLATDWLSHRYPDTPDLDPGKLGGYLGRARLYWGDSPQSQRKKWQDYQDYQRENFEKVQGRRPPKAKIKIQRDDLAQEDQVQQQAQTLVQTLLQKDQLALLENCISLEKIDKSLLPLLLEELRAQLIQARKEQCMTNSANPVPAQEVEKITKALEILPQLSQAASFHVSAAQLLSWFCAWVYQNVQPTL